MLLVSVSLQVGCPFEHLCVFLAAEDDLVRFAVTFILKYDLSVWSLLGVLFLSDLHIFDEWQETHKGALVIDFVLFIALEAEDSHGLDDDH